MRGQKAQEAKPSPKKPKGRVEKGGRSGPREMEAEIEEENERASGAARAQLPLLTGRSRQLWSTTSSNRRKE
jgi:hypothetical protein